MDMLPPQAPPAHTRTTHQEAREAYDRVAALPGWLAVEHAALPTLPERPVAATLPTFLADLDAYWNGAPADPADGVTRRAALAARLAGAARDLAILAQQDGALDEATRALVHTLTRTTDDLPPNLSVREALFDGTPYAGVLLVQDANRGDAVLMFSPDRGWETFDDLAHAHGELETRARHALVSSPDLPGIARQHVARLGSDPFVSSRPLAGAPFVTMVDRLIDARHDKLGQAWFAFGLAEEGDARAVRLADEVAEILADDGLFDAAAALAARQAQLAESMNEQRLARVPSEVADDWRNARDGYLSTLRAASDDDLPAVKGLAEFTQDALRERLRHLGVADDPADIDIDVRNHNVVVDFFVGAPPAIGLTDLAYRNIGDNDPVTLTALDPQGAPIAALDDGTLRRTIRELDIHTRYPAYLEARLRTDADAAKRRAAASVLQQAQMRFLANEARLSTFLDAEPRALRQHPKERGFRWIEAVLDAPGGDGRARVDTHPIVVSQITYQGVPVRDVLLIGAREPRSAASVILYTPHAPDGVAFREFDDRAQAAREFLYHPRFREYLLDRLPVEHAVVRANGSREFAGDRLANWVLGSPSTAGYTRTAERFDERAVEGDVFAALYDTEVRLAQRNARTLTTSSADAQSRWKDEFERKTLTAAARVVRDVVTAPIQSAGAGWQLYDSIKAGDAARSFVDFTHFYVASLWAAPGLHSLGKAALGRAVGPARFRAADRLVEAGAPPRAAAFEPAYLATGVRKQGRADHRGVFTIDGKSYIEQAGKMYGVRYDDGVQSWRLARPGAASTAWGPAVGRVGDGWAFRHVGLRGGSGRGVGNGRARQADLFDEYMDELERAFPDAMERDAVTAHIRAELDGRRPAPISDAQRQRWADACMRARARTLPVHAVGQAAAGTSSTRVLPVGLRRVPADEVPATLYFYGKLPFRDSPLLRSILRGSEGYSNHWADIRTSLIAGNLFGVRVTSYPPSTSSPILKRVTAMNTLPRRGTFSVQIDTEFLVRIVPHEGLARAEVLAPLGGPEGVYFLVPNGPADRLPLGRSFSVQNHLP